MRVSEVMSEDPVWIDVEATAGEALQRLLEKHVHHLPVLREGRVVGMVTDGDLSAFGPTVRAIRDDPMAAARHIDEPISTVMTENVFSVDPDTDVKDAADLMIEHHIGAVPVIEPEGRKLVGIVSYVDVLRIARDAIWG